MTSCADSLSSKSTPNCFCNFRRFAARTQRIALILKIVHTINHQYTSSGIGINSQYDCRTITEKVCSEDALSYGIFLSNQVEGPLPIGRRSQGQFSEVKRYGYVIHGFYNSRRERVKSIEKNTLRLGDDCSYSKSCYPSTCMEVHELPHG